MRAARHLVAGLLLVSCSRAGVVLDEHVRRGDRALERRDFPAALAAYARARELDPTSYKIQRALIRARVHQLAHDPSGLSPTALAETGYEVGFALDHRLVPKSVGLTARSHLDWRAGRSRDALDALEQAIASEPNAALPHRALGELLLVLGTDRARAKAELTRALELDPSDRRGLLSWVELLGEEGAWAEVAARLRTSLATEEDRELRLRLCLALERVGEAERLACLREGTERDPGSADAWRELGQLELAKGRLGEAEAALRRAVALRPDPNAGVSLGFALSRQGRGPEALPYFERALADAPDLAVALYGAAATYAATGRPDRATELLQRLVALDPRGPEAEVVRTLQAEAKTRLSELAGKAADAPPDGRR